MSDLILGKTDIDKQTEYTFQEWFKILRKLQGRPFLLIYWPGMVPKLQTNNDATPVGYLTAGVKPEQIKEILESCLAGIHNQSAIITNTGTNGQAEA